MPRDRNICLHSSSEPIAERERISVWVRLKCGVSSRWKSFTLCCLKLKSVCDRIFHRLFNWDRFPYVGSRPSIDELAKTSETCGWNTAKIRFITCHPSSMQRMLLTSMDTALIYENMLEKPLCLSSPKQQHLSCGAFRPWTWRQTAVGGEGGICLWKFSNGGYKTMTWLGYREGDIIVDLQWQHTGILLVTASLGNQRIQIWHPELKQVLQELSMPVMGTNYWAMRYPSDMIQLLDFLRTQSILFSYRNSMKMLSSQLVERWPLQTAVWTEQGNHLLYVIKGSSKVFGSTSTMVIGPLKQEFLIWSSKEVIDLASFFCNWHECKGGRVQSIFMDPLNIYVAFIFTRQSFVLLCLLHIPLGCSIKLKPVQIIGCTEALYAWPSCLAFGNVRRSGENVRRSLIIGWSTGKFQVVELYAQTREEALQLEEQDVQFPQSFYNIDSQ